MKACHRLDRLDVKKPVLQGDYNALEINGNAAVSSWLFIADGMKLWGVAKTHVEWSARLRQGHCGDAIARTTTVKRRLR
jgi:hypothetical protein